MSFRHGSKAAVSVNAHDLSAYCESVDLSIDVDTAETSALGDTYKGNIPGLAGGKVELKGMYDPTATTGPAAVLTGLIGADPFEVIHYPGGNVSGQLSRTFNAVLTSYNESSAVGDKVSFSASLLMDGAPTFGTVA